MNLNSTMIWLIAVPFIASPLIYLGGRLYQRRTGKSGLARWLAVLAMLVTGGFLFQAFQFISTAGATEHHALARSSCAWMASACCWLLRCWCWV